MSKILKVYKYVKTETLMSRLKPGDIFEVEGYPEHLHVAEDYPVKREKRGEYQVMSSRLIKDPTWGTEKGKEKKT